MRYFFIPLLLLALAGCMPKTTLKLYTLQPDISSISSPHKGRSARTIKVAYPKNSGGVMGTRIYYTRSNLEKNSYLYSQWSQVLNRILMGQMVRMLDATGRYRAVINYSSEASAHYTLESVIETFEHVVGPHDHYAGIAIRCNLLSGQSGRLIASKRFAYNTPSHQRSAEGFVKAANRALAQFGGDLALWLSRY